MLLNLVPIDLIVKSPRVWFLVGFHRHCSTFQLSGKTSESNFFKPHMVNLWVWENVLVPISVTLGKCHQATEAGQILPCPHDKVRIAHLIAPKLNMNISLVILPNLNKFWRKSVKNIFVNSFVKFQMSFSPTKHSICYTLGMVGTVDVKQKGNESTGYYTDYGTFDLDLWPWILKVKLHLRNGTSRSNLEFPISQPKMVQFARNKKQTYRLNARPQIGA